MKKKDRVEQNAWEGWKYGDKVRVEMGYCADMTGIIKSHIYKTLDRYIEVQDILSETHWISIPVENQHILTRER